MSVLDRYPNLEEQELTNLVTAASQVLMEFGEADQALPIDLLDMPPGSAVEIISSDLPVREEGLDQLRNMVAEPEQARLLSIEVLRVICESDLLRQAVEERYEQLEQKMFTPELFLLAGALVVLAIRIKRIKLGESEVSFYPAGDEVKAFLTSLLGKL